MILTNELLSQFAKVTKSDTVTSNEKTVYGTIVMYNGAKYVKLDGSDMLTPAESTANTKENDRVTVMIKNHSAVVTGNASSPAIGTTEQTEINESISDVNAAVGELAAENVYISGNLEAANASITNLQTQNANITGTLNAVNAQIQNLEANDVTINGTLDAANANITNLQTQNATITGQLNAANANITNLQSQNATITGQLNAANANITNLQSQNATITGRLDAVNANIENLDATYANIDFSNIGQAAMEYFYANSGLIEDVTIGDGTITGNLVGVTISGDLIEGNTIKAEKLVIKGSDGLYYQLNTDGMTTTTQQTDYNSLNGSVIRAKTITATQISVKDLVAFDATIGGFNITDNALYSGVKESVGNTTRGVYMDSTGQMAIGDATNYIKYYKDTDGSYKLAISAKSISLASGTNVETAINNAQTAANNAQSTANSAQTAATTAQNAANAAQDTANSAQTAANNAQGAADNAQSSANSANTAASNAQTAANAAQGAADNAQSSAESAQDAANTAQDTANANSDLINNNLRQAILQINETISSLVQGEGGSSLMTQTETGWSFNISGITDNIETVSQGVADLGDAQNATNEAVSNLQESLDNYGNYIEFTTIDSKPAIVLGKRDSEFKVVITNEEIKFMEGSTTPAYINNEALNIEKAVVKNELKQGGFVWMARDNGNYGLMWKGV